MNRLNIKHYMVIIGLVLILSLHFSLLFFYFTRHNPKEESHQDEKMIYAMINMVQQGSNAYKSLYDGDDYQKFVNTDILIKEHGLRISFSKIPKNKVIFQAPNALTALSKYLRNNTGQYNFSVETNSGYWLNFSTIFATTFYVMNSLFLLIEMILFGLILFYILAIKHYAIPLKNFKQIAENLAMDFHANPVQSHYVTPLTKATEKAILNLQNRIKTIIDNRTRMIAAISHDLRTPITRLKLLVQFIEGSEQNEKILSNLDEMDHMINEVLNFSRIDAFHEQKVKLNIDALLNSICEDFSDLGYDLNYINNSDTTLIYGRFLALKRAFINIVQNGLRYGDMINISLEKFNEELVTLSFEDNGPGIHEDELTKIAKPFYRGVDVNSVDNVGSGLGLTIVHEIINAHDGNLTFENKHKGGLKVMVSLPIR